MIRRLLACGAAGLIVIASCEPGPPKLYPVKGKIVNVGKGSVKDVAGYNVRFQSTTDPNDMPGGGIEEDGTFVLYSAWHGQVRPGARAGKYRASLEQAPLEGRKPPPPVIPTRYLSYETSGLEFTIEPQPNELTIEINRSGK
jgi:hypothetical protein